MKNEFIQWCEEHARECRAQHQSLNADGRIDEARFMQIRANVFGIFPPVYTAVKGALPLLLERLTSITAVWEESLRMAEVHGEHEKAHIERIKLETAQAIRHYANHLEAKTHD